MFSGGPLYAYLQDNLELSDGLVPPTSAQPMKGDDAQKMSGYSIIVLCHNNQYIDHCVCSIRRQMQAEDELIVVDDHSDKSCKAILCVLEKTGQITLIRAERKCGNRSHNRNLGASVAANDILIFVEIGRAHV